MKEQQWYIFPKGSWDVYWVIFGTFTADPYFLTCEWQTQTRG